MAPQITRQHMAKQALCHALPELTRWHRAVEQQVGLTAQGQHWCTFTRCCIFVAACLAHLQPRVSCQLIPVYGCTLSPAHQTPEVQQGCKEANSPT